MRLHEIDNDMDKKFFDRVGKELGKELSLNLTLADYKRGDGSRSITYTSDDEPLTLEIKHTWVEGQSSAKPDTKVLVYDNGTKVQEVVRFGRLAIWWDDPVEYANALNYDNEIGFAIDRLL